jgi:hypothetical protein
LIDLVCDDCRSVEWGRMSMTGTDATESLSGFQDHLKDKIDAHGLISQCSAVMTG